MALNPSESDIFSSVRGPGPPGGGPDGAAGGRARGAAGPHGAPRHLGEVASGGHQERPCPDHRQA